MAKRESTAGRQAAGDAQGRTLAGFAEDLGRLLGQTERKATEWLQQRQAVAQQLSAIRDKATDLLNQLGVEVSNRVGRGARKTGRRRRKLSKETRMKMAEAARRRWAALRKAAGK